MDDKWKIELYKTANNKSPIDDFVDGLDVKIQNKIIEVFSLLREFGTNLGMPHSRKVSGTPLWTESSILQKQEKLFFYYTLFKRKSKKPTERK